MRAVRDEDGRMGILLTKSDGTALIRDPDTGNERNVPSDRLTSVEDDERAHPSPTRGLLAATNECTLAILLILDGQPRSARWLLDHLDLCESDLHGSVGDLRAAGLVESTTVDGEPGYRTTTVASEGLDGLRSSSAGRT